MWYRREEQALVIGAFYSMNGFQQCVGGLLAYGVAHIHNQPLKNWQILFTVRPYLCVVVCFGVRPLIAYTAAWLRYVCMGNLRWILAPGLTYACQVLLARGSAPHG